MCWKKNRLKRHQLLLYLSPLNPGLFSPCCAGVCLKLINWIILNHDVFEDPLRTIPITPKKTTNKINAYFGSKTKQCSVT